MHYLLRQSRRFHYNQLMSSFRMPGRNPSNIKINFTHFYTCSVHLSLFCTLTNKCTIIYQIITLLHVSTLSCHPQTACNQYLAKLHQYFNTCTVHLLLFCTVTNKCTVISQIITLLHVSTVSCRPQTACNQYLAKLHQYFKCSCR